MKATQASLILVALAMLLSGACKYTVDRKAAEKSAKATVDSFARFWEMKDTALLARIMAHDTDMVCYGSDQSERFVGYKMFEEAVTQMLPALADIRITTNNQVVKLSNSGDVAWFSEVWNWSLKMEGKPVQMNGQRLTCTLENRDGNWVIVQFHNSVPVMPQEAPASGGNNGSSSTQ